MSRNDRIDDSREEDGADDDSVEEEEEEEDFEPVSGQFSMRFSSGQEEEVEKEETIIRGGPLRRLPAWNAVHCTAA